MGATQAAVVDDGPTAPAAAVIAGGPQTTGCTRRRPRRAARPRRAGLVYQWLLEGADYAQFELQTADGGALVMYAMYLNTTTEHPGGLSGSPIPVPAEFAPLIVAPTEVGYHEVDANWTYEFAAVDPPQTAQGAKVQVIGGQRRPHLRARLLAGGRPQVPGRVTSPAAGSWRRPGSGWRAAPPTRW